jgi:hypothetical protein
VGSRPISRGVVELEPLGEKKPQTEEMASTAWSEAHGLADLAHRALAAVVDDGGAEPGAVAAVAAVDVLDHLLAAFVLEVDVDVGGLVAGLGDEALEDQVPISGGVDRGDAEA